MLALSYRLAMMADAVEISALVNAAYRGETSRRGWTTEADLLEGLRTTTSQIEEIVGASNQRILLCCTDEKIIGTICLESQHNVVHIGMFVVSPNLQGNGVGKQLLTYAENYVKQAFSTKKVAMHVITVRHELIAFYERRGYQRTGGGCSRLA